jgi:hypothetical protein
MEIPLKTIINSAPALNALAAQKLGAKQSFIIAKALKAIAPEMETYDQARLKAAARLGTLNSTTNQYEFVNGEQETFLAEMVSLVETMVRVEAAIPLSAIEHASLTPQEMMAIAWVITE